MISFRFRAINTVLSPLEHFQNLAFVTVKAHCFQTQVKKNMKCKASKETRHHPTTCTPQVKCQKHLLQIFKEMILLKRFVKSDSNSDKAGLPKRHFFCGSISTTTTLFSYLSPAQTKFQIQANWNSSLLELDVGN